MTDNTGSHVFVPESGRMFFPRTKWWPSWQASFGQQAKELPSIAALSRAANDRMPYQV
jgi:hypothetical protein